MIVKVDVIFINQLALGYLIECLALPPIGTDEDVIIDLLSSRTNFQRQQIIKAFKSSYDQVIKKVLIFKP